ncbi:MAG: archaetidylserine decarboxylase [Planctomyces sp.]|jgi:phosphatidylserine decarboxylase
MRVRLEQFRQAREIHGGTLNMMGAALGVKLSRIPIPTAALRRKVFRMLYGGKYQALDEAELEMPLEHYPSINALFTRGIRPEQRPIPTRIDQFLSPVDGTVQDHGLIHDDTVMTVKGVRYTLESLCPETNVHPYRDGRFAILFLSPRDCHRVFTPAEGVLEKLVHVPGHRLLVHPPFQRPEFPVFALNERLVMELDTTLGRCLMIMVAGWGVGHITHPFRLAHRFSPRRVSVTKLDPARNVARNEWIATFELGSTVILIVEKGLSSEALFQKDQQIRIGEPLYDAIPARSEDTKPEISTP